MPDLDGVTILVVEDEEPIRKLYVEWLNEAGATTHQAANGQEALEEWDESIDAVILDRRLPEYYGDEVLEQARERGLDTPVSMATAVDPEVNTDFVEMEFDEYITKPIEKPELFRTIDKLIRTTQLRDSVREFISVGVKVQKLRKKHPEDLLKTHAEFQKLKKRYNSLHADLQENHEDLSETERKALLAASKRLSQ